MRSEAINELNDTIIKMAIKKLDKEKMALSMAKTIELEFEKAVKNIGVDGFDFEYYIKAELEDETSPAGKQLQKALSAITKRMAEAI